MKTSIICTIIFLAIGVHCHINNDDMQRYFRSPRPQDFHQSVLDDIGCKLEPTREVYHRLNDICEQCYGLFVDLGIYHACRYELLLPLIVLIQLIISEQIALAPIISQVV